jgi:hypothetical protein
MFRVLGIYNFVVGLHSIPHPKPLELVSYELDYMSKLPTNAAIQEIIVLIMYSP